MLTILPFWIAPALFVVACTILLFMDKWKWRRASLYGITAFGLFLLLGTSSILQSRSSTAAIGFVFLPIIALLPGVIGLVLGKIHTSYLQRKQNNRPLAVQKIGMIILSLLIITPFIWQVTVLLNTVSKNKSRDIENARQREAIKNNIKELDILLTENPGREVDILKEKVGQTQDRTKLIPIAKNMYASSEILNKLSLSTDFGVVLCVVRNRNTSKKTLEWVYQNQTYPPYFYTGLSSNPNTPKEIFKELYDKRSQNAGIALQLARNPNLPCDILNELTNIPRKYVLRNILDRSDITCEQVKSVRHTMNKLKDTDIRRLIDQSKDRMESCIQSKQP